MRLPPVDRAARRERLRARVVELELDALLITAAVNVRWATGFTGSSGQLLLAADGDHALITDARYEARAAEEAGDLPLVLRRDPVGVACERLTAPRLGFEAAALSWADGEVLRERVRADGGAGEPTTGIVEEHRAVKDDHELELLRRACRVTSDALEWLLADVVAEGRTETELARALERRLVEAGAESVAFAPIVAGGPNAAVPHHAPGDRPLVAGDVLVVDCGARVGGYHADCTRTSGIGGLDDELVAVHELVLRAQEAGRAAVLAGATAGEVDAAARDPIEAAGHGSAFVHGTGHGVGLEVHEAPAVGHASPATLRRGMALTVEPGVYLPGVGGVRIEDTVVVTADGPATPLTDLTRELRLA